MLDTAFALIDGQLLREHLRQKRGWYRLRKVHIRFTLDPSRLEGHLG